MSSSGLAVGRRRDVCAAWGTAPACCFQRRSPWHCWKLALRSLFLAPLPSRLPSGGPWVRTERDAAASRSRRRVQPPTTLQRLRNRPSAAQSPCRCAALGAGVGKTNGAARRLSRKPTAALSACAITSRPPPPAHAARTCCEGQELLQGNGCRDENRRSSNPAPRPGSPSLRVGTHKPGCAGSKPS